VNVGRLASTILAPLLAAWGPAVWAAPNALAGHWVGSLEQHGQKLAIAYDLQGDEAHASGRFSADTWRVMDYPLGKVAFNGDHVRFSMGGDALEGERKGDEIQGKFKGDDGEGSFTLRRKLKPALPYREFPVTWRNGSVTLFGTLAMPTTPGRHPAVVLLQGSGPESRWGTNRYIADRFARAGIAALAYDKRGSGQSTGDWRDGGYETLAGDAMGAVELLAARRDVDPRRIGLHGHSEGGMVAPLAATMAPARVAFLVAEDTYAGRVSEQDIYRTQNEVAGEDFSEADKVKELAMYRLFISVISGDRPYADLETASAAVRNDAWFKDLNLPPRSDPAWTWYPRRSHFDTRTVWAKIRQPVLLIYGEHDQLIPVDESMRRITDLLDASQTPYTALIAPRAEHNLTIKPQKAEAFFWWHKAPGVIETVVNWVKTCTGAGGPCRAS